MSPATRPSDLAPACDCHTKVNAKLAEFNTGLSFNFFGGFRAILATYKLVSKVRGYARPVAASYCPFCGVKYPGDQS